MRTLVQHCLENHEQEEAVGAGYRGITLGICDGNLGESADGNCGRATSLGGSEMLQASACTCFTGSASSSIRPPEECRRPQKVGLHPHQAPGSLSALLESTNWIYIIGPDWCLNTGF